MSKRPLVYCSSLSRRAKRLLPEGAVLENVVRDAIVAGRVSAGANGGVIFLDNLGLVAHAERRPGRLRARGRQWLVVNLQLLEVEHDGNSAIE